MQENVCGRNNTLQYKSKTMVFGEEITDMEIKVQDEVIENVNEFVGLGSLLTWNNNCAKEIKRRL